MFRRVFGFAAMMAVEALALSSCVGQGDPLARGYGFDLQTGEVELAYRVPRKTFFLSEDIPIAVSFGHMEKWSALVAMAQARLFWNCVPIEAAQTVADVFLDHHFLKQHKGGYTAFVTELTDYLEPGRESKLEIRVSNAQTMDIAPICGDFNIYGGLYRGVELIVTDDVCISPDYFASSGVFFTQSNVSERQADLKVEAGNAGCDTGIFAWTGYGF